MVNTKFWLQVKTSNKLNAPSRTLQRKIHQRGVHQNAIHSKEYKRRLIKHKVQTSCKLNLILQLPK